MKNIKLGFFIGTIVMVVPLVSRAQDNTLGDRTTTLEEQHHKAYKTKITRKQKLLFRKPSVRHSPTYEYFREVERIAREKQTKMRKEIEAEYSNLPYKMTRKQKLRYQQNVTHMARYEYYKTVEWAAKRRQRMLLEAAKPQYSNFAYFGHKHLPKKHLPYAMRYCKECGIRH